MKTFFLLLGLFSWSAFSQTVQNCGVGMMQVWTQSVGMACAPRILPAETQYLCLPVTQQVPANSWVQSFTGPLFQSGTQTWWSTQGNLYFPNVSYPGAWSYPGIEARYYPGQGQVFAAKPNVYVESIHSDKKFTFSFISNEKPSFLATTPVLEKETWKGKIVEKDKFEVNDVNYDYLFYDVRLPQEKMQFDNGLCATREGAIEWMLKDLKEMRYSAYSLQDFEEHWRVKIPDYPYYCIYPQYNRELDAALPVAIDLEQSTFVRSLYVLVPHKKEPDVDDPQEIPFPQNDPNEFRPGVKIQRENMFREWGVAFLGF